MNKVESVNFNNIANIGAFKGNTKPEKKAVKDNTNSDAKLKYALIGLAAIGAAAVGTAITLYKKKSNNLQMLSQENEKIRQLALQRQQDEKMIEHAQRTQDELMEVLYPKTPEKSAQESAKVFEERFKTIEESFTRNKKVSYRLYQVVNDKQYGSIAVQGNRAKVLKKINPETLAALNDDQIRILLTRPSDIRLQDVIKVLETRFEPEKLRQISVSDDWFKFTHEIFDSLEGKANLDNIVEKYNSKVFHLV